MPVSSSSSSKTMSMSTTSSSSTKTMVTHQSYPDCLRARVRLTIRGPQWDRLLDVTFPTWLYHVRPLHFPQVAIKLDSNLWELLDSKLIPDTRARNRNGADTLPEFEYNPFRLASAVTSTASRLAIGEGVQLISPRTVQNIASGYTMYSGMSPYGQYASMSIRDGREREKKQMSELNDRLANYIEKVRFLEAQNRKLGGDLDMLRSRWGKDTSSMRVMFECELKEARALIDATNRTRAELEAQIAKLILELAEYRRLYEEAVLTDRVLHHELLEKLSKLEAEINLLKRKIAHIEEDVVRIKKENHRLIGELQRARNELDQETLNRIDHQTRVQALLEEIDFVRRVHDQEIKELQSMVSRDTTPENREFFKNELASAIRDIRQEYDQRMLTNRTDIESWYKLKVQEIATSSKRQTMEHAYQKEETRRLRTHLSDLRSKLADLEGRNALLEKQTEELNYQLEDDQRKVFDDYPMRQRSTTAMRPSERSGRSVRR
uniref:IF rod domain-containing protein n=1 Tax=Pristionchus pacificus TaxID=54126 RepID=A0A2A6B6K8_PRIPA|eukprot:PDM61512.1 hypothetical protein PRIPAC_50954 [Pristionchus pacificus]